MWINNSGNKGHLPIFFFFAVYRNIIYVWIACTTHQTINLDLKCVKRVLCQTIQIHWKIFQFHNILSSISIYYLSSKSALFLLKKKHFQHLYLHT